MTHHRRVGFAILLFGVLFLVGLYAATYVRT
jgi:hypothetical protein